MYQAKKVMRTFRIIGVILLMVMLASCNDFLTENPQSSFGVSNFYNTRNDFVQAVNAIYAEVQDLYAGKPAYVLMDLRSDNITCDEAVHGNCGSVNEGLQQIDQFTLGPANGVIERSWIKHYEAIGRANRVITYIKDEEFNNKAILAGQAKALRAYFYFNLVRQFGEVPVVTKPKLKITKRASVDSVYTQIISDLKDAVTSLPVTYDDASDQGRITKGGAQSLLGLVYLTRHNYSAAANEFQNVVTSGHYSLKPNYSDLWITSKQGKGHESVWGVIFKEGTRGEGNKLPNWYAPTIGHAALSLFGETGRSTFAFFIPTHNIVQAYKSKDERKDCIADGFTDVKTGVFYSVNYVKCYVQQYGPSGNKTSGADWYIIRYANVLLWYAEAINEANHGPTAPAYDALNDVRNRAGLSDFTKSGYKNFQDQVYLQERLESPFEGKRWNNLRRTGRAVKVMNSKIASDSTTVGPVTQITKSQLLLPLPQVAIQRSNLTQNPGY